MKKLPIELNPPAKTYQHFALPLAAGLAGNPDILLFVLNRFHQVYYTPNGDSKFTFYYTNFMNWSCLQVQTTLCKDMVQRCGWKLRDVFQNSIDQGLYIYINVDEFYVPHRKGYQKAHNRHDMLIFGYDGDMVDILGYDEHMVFTPVQVHWQQLEQGFFETGRNEIMYLFNSAWYYQNVFDPVLNIEMMSDYVFSRNTSLRHRFYRKPTEKMIYGMDAFARLIEEAKENIANDGSIDIRYWDLLCEHKRIMALRLEKLHAIRDLADIPEQYAQVVAGALQLKNLVLKANGGKHFALVERMQERLSLLLEKERALLTQVMDRFSEG